MGSKSNWNVFKCNFVFQYIIYLIISIPHITNRIIIVIRMLRFPFPCVSTWVFSSLSRTTSLLSTLPLLPFSVPLQPLLLYSPSLLSLLFPLPSSEGHFHWAECPEQWKVIDPISIGLMLRFRLHFPLINAYVLQLIYFFLPGRMESEGEVSGRVYPLDSPCHSPAYSNKCWITKVNSSGTDCSTST